MSMPVIIRIIIIAIINITIRARKYDRHITRVREE